MNLLKRIREPSTWTAIAVLLGLVGVNPIIVHALGQLMDAAPAVIQVLSLVGGGGAAVAGVMLPEAGSE